MPVQPDSLFERLLLGKRGYAPSRETSTSAVLASVLRNINRILNTNQGSSTARPDYGIPDFNQIIQHFPDAVPWLTNLLTEQIHMFEPRIQFCHVRYVSDEDAMLSQGMVTLNFVITAKLADRDGDVIRFETVFADDRRFYAKP